MSTRTTLRPHPVITNGDMSGDIISEPTILQSLTSASYAVKWEDGISPIGTLAVQMSDDYELGPSGQVVNAGTWNTAPLSVDGTYGTSIPVSGSADNGFIDILGTAAYAVRLVFTATSGSGTMNAVITGKVS